MLNLLVILLSVVAASSALTNVCFDEYGFVRMSGEKWPDSVITCRKFLCDNGTRKEFYTGCVWNKQCFAAGRRWRDGCTRMRCIAKTPFKDVKIYSIESEVLCEHEGRCYKNGRKWRMGCNSFQCEIKKGSDGYTRQTVIPTLRCSWRNGCKGDQEVWGRGCIRYQCHVFKDKYGGYSSSVTVNARCRGRRPGECIAKGADVNVGCHTFTCRNTSGTLQLVVKRLACKDKSGACVQEGKTASEGCTTYQCQKKGVNSMALVPIKVGCLYKDTCVAVNKTWYNQTECVRYTCKKSPRMRRRIHMALTLSHHGCPVDGRCRKKGDRWTDKACIEMVCKIIPYGRQMVQKARVIKQKCKDVNGRCRDWGDKFTGMVNLVRYKNCICKRTGRRTSKMICKK